MTFNDTFMKRLMDRSLKCYIFRHFCSTGKHFNEFIS